MIEDLRNSFEEKNINMLVLDSKKITDYAAVESVQNVIRIGGNQFQASLENTSLKDLRSATKYNVSQGKHQMTSLKSDVGLSRDFPLGAILEMEILRSSFAMRIRPVFHHSMMAVTSI